MAHQIMQLRKDEEHFRDFNYRTVYFDQFRDDVLRRQSNVLKPIDQLLKS